MSSNKTPCSVIFLQRGLDEVFRMLHDPEEITMSYFMLDMRSSNIFLVRFEPK